MEGTVCTDPLIVIREIGTDSGGALSVVRQSLNLILLWPLSLSVSDQSFKWKLPNASTYTNTVVCHLQPSLCKSAWVPTIWFRFSMNRILAPRNLVLRRLGLNRLNHLAEFRSFQFFMTIGADIWTISLVSGEACLCPCPG